jgi:glycosyltransferase involved in cell wall biosynthesis
MSKDSKKALLTSNIRLTDTNGKSLRLLSLAELLNSAGFEVTLIVSECDSIMARKFSIIETKTDLRNTLSDNLLEKVFHYTKQFIKLLSFYAKFLILKVNCDIIVSSLVGPEIDSLFACMLSKIKRTPFVYDYDDPSPEIRMFFYKCGANDPRVKLSILSRNILIRNASLILTSAETISRQIAENFRKTKRVYTWYNLPKTDDIYINIDKNKNRLRRKLGLSTKSFIISYIGNVPNWGVETLRNILIDCAGNFKCDKNVLFLIIGGGPWEEYYRKLIKRLRLTDCILITGSIARRNALEYLMVSNVSFIPFGFNCASMHILPTKLFEAMALGVPILCARLPNLFQILGDDGIYFDDTHDITKKIRWCIMNQEKLDKISTNLKSKFFSEYTWEKRCLSLVNVLRGLQDSSSK